MPSSPQELLDAAEGLAATSAEPLLRAAISQPKSSKAFFKDLVIIELSRA